MKFPKEFLWGLSMFLKVCSLILYHYILLKTLQILLYPNHSYFLPPNLILTNDKLNFNAHKIKISYREEYKKPKISC